MDYLAEFKKEFKKFKIRRVFKENIEPEEILLDAEKIPEFYDQKIETPLKKKTFMAFFGVMLSGLLVLAVFAGYLQIFKNKDYSALAQRNSRRYYLISSPRGVIYDRNLNPLVANLPAYNVFLAPPDLPKSKDERDNIIGQINNLLGLNPETTNQKLRDFNPQKEQRILLAGNLSAKEISALEAKKDSLPAVSIEETVRREYLFGEAVSHILGHTGLPDQKDVGGISACSLTDRVGKAGLEAWYENILRGENGQHIREIDATGRQIRDLGEKDPITGNNIVTTIDIGLQQEMFRVLSDEARKIKAKKAAAVALDPTNGQILAMVSLPSFDNNIFEGGVSLKDLNKIFLDPDNPLFNRVISGQYPSGSTIKPLIASAALQERVVTPSTTVDDSRGNLQIVNQYNPQIVYNFPDWKAHGIVNIYSAIAQSCNVYFYIVGGGYGNIQGLGIDRIKKYLNLFGLGQKTGIDLPDEADGLVPDPEWKKSVKNESWFVGDTYHVSIGQGDLLVTPLQMAIATASIANDGKLFVPYLVDKITDSDKNVIKTFAPRLIRQNFIDSKNLAVVREGMRRAVTAGSASFLKDLPFAAAGKTGTAQLVGQEKNNAWFVGFAPYDNPKIVLSILIENVGEGSSYAVPVAKEILNWYLGK